MTTKVTFDPNGAVGEQGMAFMSDVVGPVSVGQAITALEDESGSTWRATITEIDKQHNVVLFAIDWDSFERAAPQKIIWVAVEANTNSFSRTTRKTTNAAALDRFKNLAAKRTRTLKVRAR